MGRRTESPAVGFRSLRTSLHLGRVLRLEEKRGRTRRHHRTRRSGGQGPGTTAIAVDPGRCAGSGLRTCLLHGNERNPCRRAEAAGDVGVGGCGAARPLAVGVGKDRWAGDGHGGAVAGRCSAAGTGGAQPRRCPCRRQGGRLRWQRPSWRSRISGVTSSSRRGLRWRSGGGAGVAEVQGEP